MSSKTSMTMAIALVLTVFIAVGCASVRTPVNGILVTNVKGPIDAEGTVGSKQGQACASSILGLFASGDASISAAAAEGGITTIDTVEDQSKTVLGLWSQYCTIVHGK